MSRPFSWINPHLEVRETGAYGRGVFATRKVPSGEVLIVMGGYICNTAQENELGELATNYNMDISEEWSFCPTQESDIDRMPQHIVNHSCEPNAGFSEQCFMVAIRDIEPGEEVVYDYAFVMWSSDDSELHFEMDCACGTPSCRHVVREDDWKLPDLQQKYGQWFQPFLRKRFNI